MIHGGWMNKFLLENEFLVSSQKRIPGHTKWAKWVEDSLKEKKGVHSPNGGNRQARRTTAQKNKETSEFITSKAGHEIVQLLRVPL